MKKYGIILGSVLILGVIIVGIVLLNNTKSNSEIKILLGNYMDIEIEFNEIIVTDEDVENSLIDAITSNQEDVEITNRPVRKGDTVNIDYSGKLDGVEFEGGTDTGFDLEIGSGSFIDGFEEQIIGMNVGQIADITVTFPETYRNNADLAGAETVFTIKVNSIYGKEIPEQITDDMVKEVSSSYTTVEEYREYIRSELEAKAKETSDYNKQEAIWKAVIKNAKVENLSREKVDYYSNLFESDYQYYADLYGMDLESFIEAYLGITVAEFNAEKKAYAEELTTAYAIAEAIAIEQSVSVSDEEYQKYLTENGLGEDEIKQYGEAIQDGMLYQKVIEFITNNAKIRIKN